MDVARGPFCARYGAAILIFQMVLCVPALAGQTSLPAHAQPFGQPLTTILEFGDQYNGGDELYDAQITVLEVVRGEQAWTMVKSASDSNKPPDVGFEYLLARIRFEFSARTRCPRHHYRI